LMTKYSRDDEREADRLGMGYASQRGYDVSEAAGFFHTLQRISSREGVRLPSWQSTHPDPGEREATATKMARNYERTGAIKSVGEDRLLQQLEGMVVGDNPREGFVRNQTFYHPDFEFQFPIPQGWRVQNERAAVLMAAPDRSGMMVLQAAPGSSAERAAADMVSSQELRVRDTKRTTINGRPAVAVTGEAATQQGTAALGAFFIEHQGKVYAFIGLAGPQAFRTLAPQFERVATGFRTLTDRRILDLQPARIRIVEARSPSNLATLMPTSDLPGLTVQDVAILNQVEPSETIQPGMKLKIPQVENESRPGNLKRPVSAVDGRQRISRPKR
ncbi:peptidase M48, partial [bacterium]|nr:peptidase M48 [bacterium]